MPTKKSTPPTREPDEVRELILDLLYDHHKQARGVRAQELKITDLQRKAKVSQGLVGKEVAAALDYLVQKGWVREISRDRSYTTPRGASIPREQVTYKITDVGIDRVEGESRFKKQSPFGAINIGNVQGAVVIGDRNVINNQFLGLAEQLETLEEGVSSLDLPDDEKLSVISDIETIKSQLAKSTPDRNILKQAWSAIEGIVTAHGFGNILVETSRLIGPLMR